jgi:hypothetical protein
MFSFDLLLRIGLFIVCLPLAPQAETMLSRCLDILRLLREELPMAGRLYDVLKSLAALSCPVTGRGTYVRMDRNNRQADESVSGRL